MEEPSGDHGLEDVTEALETLRRYGVPVGLSGGTGGTSLPVPMLLKDLYMPVAEGGREVRPGVLVVIFLSSSTLVLLFQLGFEEEGVPVVDNEVRDFPMVVL